jgi:hypothetical protein
VGVLVESRVLGICEDGGGVMEEVGGGGEVTLVWFADSADSREGEFGVIEAARSVDDTSDSCDAGIEAGWSSMVWLPGGQGSSERHVRGAAESRYPNENSQLYRPGAKGRVRSASEGWWPRRLAGVGSQARRT